MKADGLRQENNKFCRNRLGNETVSGERERLSTHTWREGQLSAPQRQTEGCRQKDRQTDSCGQTDGSAGRGRQSEPPPGPLTRVDVFLVSLQGIPALQPLPTAVGLAHEPGFAPARLLVLLAAAGQGEGPEAALSACPSPGRGHRVHDWAERTAFRVCSPEHRATERPDACTPQ